MGIDTAVIDAVTVGFELVTTIGAWADVATLYRSRSVEGVSLVASAFRTLGGLWMLFLYWHFGLWWATALGFVWALAAVSWLGLSYAHRKSV